MDLRRILYAGLVPGFVALALFLAPMTTAAAQPPAETPAAEKAQPQAEKPPWEWTLEERLNARFDPQKIRERMANRGHNHQQDAASVPESYEVLSGQEHPHLFLPSRVFDAMIDKAFWTSGDLRSGLRRQMAERYQGELEIDEDFWRDLSIVVASYLSTKADFEDLERAYLTAESDQDQGRLKVQVQKDNLARCRARYQALEVAREHFGGTEFDRFLYEAVAVELWESGHWTPELRSARVNIAKGCPHGF